ncbi:hypothetical protein EDD15DRAFT_141275 [Pisolithus albus]|nr:hypothetical protein EDD15DRAFT_141275 [Pisolithus albus]
MSSTNPRQNVVHRRTRASSSMISPEAQMSGLHLDHSLGTTRDLVERNAMSTSFSSMPPDEGLHLRRAGLLQPQSSSAPLRIPRVSGDIRESTVQLSNLPFSPPGRSFVVQEWSFTSDQGSCVQRTREQNFDSDHAYIPSPSPPIESVAFPPHSGQGRDRDTGGLDPNSHPPNTSIDIASVLTTDSPALSPAAESSQEMGTSKKTHEDAYSGNA